MAQVPIIDVIADMAQLVLKCPNATIIRAYNRAARDFCRQSRWLRVAMQGQTEEGSSQYSLGSDPDLEVIGLKAVTAASLTGNTKPYPLRVSDQTRWAPDQQAGAPRRYAYVPDAQIALNPTPDRVYQLQISLVVQPALGSSMVDQTLVTRWDQTLQAGALAFLYEIPEQPWTNVQHAELKRRMFQSGVNSARGDEQREYQAGSQIARKAPFIVGRM